MVLISCTSSRFLRYQNVPAPSGDYLVGSKIFEWTDSSRADIFSIKDDVFRKIIVQVWYPGKNHSEENENFSYFQNDEITATKLANHFSVPKAFVAGAVKLKTHALMNLDPLLKNAPYPLIIFSHGRGGYRHQNSIQCEELASRGYVVVAVNHTYDSFITIFRDGSSAPYLSEKLKEDSTGKNITITTPEKLELRVGDARFLLDQIDDLRHKNPLFKIIDLNKIGMFGHSFGGATTIAMANEDRRIDAAAGLDAWFIPLSDTIIKEGMKIPFLHLGQRRWAGMPKNYSKMKDLFNNSSAPVHHLSANRMKHYDFTDGPQYASSAKILIPFFSWENRSEMRKMLNTMIIVFFDLHLKNKSGESINQAARKFSKILIN